MSIRNIDRELGLSKKTVSLWLKRWAESRNLNNGPRGHPQRKTTTEQDHQIVEAAETNPLNNTVAIREQLQLDVSAETVRRRLQAEGIHHRTPATKQLLTARHREDRLRLAENHLQDSLDDWAGTVFTDGKTFASTSHGKLYCWRRNNAGYSITYSLMLQLFAFIICQYPTMRWNDDGGKIIHYPVYRENQFY